MVGDARAALARIPPGSLDLLVLDVFAGARIPAHLTSIEFLRSAAAVLDRGGVYAANLADGGRLEFARAQVAAAAAVLPELALVAAPDVLHGRRFGNLVLVAGSHALPVPELVRRVAADPFPARVLAGAELRGSSGPRSRRPTGWRCRPRCRRRASSVVPKRSGRWRPAPTTAWSRGPTEHCGILSVLRAVLGSGNEGSSP